MSVGANQLLETAAEWSKKHIGLAYMYYDCHTVGDKLQRADCVSPVVPERVRVRLKLTLFVLPIQT